MPAPSLDYTLTPLSGDQYTSCLCGSERKTLSWTMAPSALGEGQAFIHTGVKCLMVQRWRNCCASFSITTLFHLYEISEIHLSDKIF